MIARNEQEMRDLHDILYAMELRFTERETEAKQEFQGLVDELKNKVYRNYVISWYNNYIKNDK